MKRRLLLASPAVLLAACAQPKLLIPAAGSATAELNDSLAENPDGAGRRVFVVWSIDGVEIPNAIRSARRVGFGAGAATVPYFLARPVAAKSMVVEVIGQHLAGAPIEELVRSAKGTFQRARGKLQFQPVADITYQVSGRLSPEICELWIEEFESKKRVTDILRVTSDA